MTNVLATALVLGLGAPELLIIVGILVLLFGATKLPELARGSGRALRIFKAETKGLLDDDDEKTPEQRELEARNRERDTTSDPRSDHHADHHAERRDLDDRQPPGGSGTS